MKLTDFVIGERFWTHGGEFRCTDVGTRVVVAVKLGPREIARAANADGEHRMMKRVDDDGTRLRKEVRILAEEREILKKAAAFFAKQSR